MGIDVVIRLIDADNEDEKVKVVKMVNQCYRSHRGWTTEVGLVQGDRLTMQNLEDQIRRYSFFLADHDSFGVIGCIKTGIVNSTVIGPLSQPAGYAGVLAVLPEFQGKRIGSRLLSFAESFCRGKGAQRMVSFSFFIWVVLWHWMVVSF